MFKKQNKTFQPTALNKQKQKKAKQTNKKIAALFKVARKQASHHRLLQQKKQKKDKPSWINHKILTVMFKKTKK